MNRDEGTAGLPRWATSPRFVMLFAVGLLFALMAWAFLVAPWTLPASQCGGGLCSIPITPTGAANETGSVTGSLFGGYVILVFVIALVLASCMIGGVFLAKMEGGPRP